MKTSAIAVAGLVLAAVLGFSATGCRINHYGSRGAATEPGDQARARARARARAQEQEQEQEQEQAPCKATCGACGPQKNAPCQCKKPVASARAAAPPPECQVDWDCPEEMVCSSGSCK